MTEFADITQEPNGLPPHTRGTFDHTIYLTDYPKRQRRKRLYVPNMRNLRNNAPISSNME